MSQAKYGKLGELGFSGAINERYLKWLQSLGATARDIQTAERQALATAGTVGKANNDIRKAYYQALGYTGNLNEAESQFWKDLTIGPTFKPIENIFAELDPAFLNNSYTLNGQPSVIIPTTSRVTNVASTYSSVPQLQQISEAGEFWYDGEFRFTKRTSNGFPVIALAHEADDPTYSGGERAEIDFFFSTPANRTFPYQEEFWDSAHINFPDRVSTDPSKVIWQWHQSGATVNPFFSLSITGNNLQVEIRYNDQASPTQATNVVFSQNIATLPAAGTPFVITINAKCSHLLADSPFIKIWLNETLILDRNGTNGRCGYNLSATRFHRWGFYAWQGLAAGTRREYEIRGAVRARLPTVGNYTVQDLIHHVSKE